MFLRLFLSETDVYWTVLIACSNVLTEIGMCVGKSGLTFTKKLEKFLHSTNHKYFKLHDFVKGVEGISLLCVRHETP